MPGVTYTGFAAKFADKRFARRAFAFNLTWLCLLSLWVIWRGDGSELPKVNTCETVSIEWDEFVKHSCDNENLWVLVDGMVLDMWPWGTFNRHMHDDLAVNNYYRCYATSWR